MGFFNFKREIKWDKDVMKVTDSVSNIWDSIVNEMSDKMENETTSEVLRHFNIDMSELREFLRDKEEWRRKQEAAIPKWIPVTERLPECEVGAEIRNVEWISHDMVFAGCFGRGGKYRDAYFRTWTDTTEGIDAKDADCWRVVTLPEPPKEEKE